MKNKRFLAVLLVVAMMVSMGAGVGVAEDNRAQVKDGAADQAKSQLSINEIIDQYHSQLKEVSASFDFKSSAGRSISSLQSAKAEVKSQTISLLASAGYTAYDVNPSSFNDVGEMLQTDLGRMGLNPNYSYIVIVGDDESNTQTRGVGSPFSYTYNGTIYSLRYLTIAATDDSNYGKVSTVDVLQSSNNTLIQNCLDTAISLMIGSISEALGVVASICGLSVSMFSPAQTSTLYLNGGTNWTRVFTQVWSASASQWFPGSCVEYVHCTSYMSGLYYSASQNRYVSVPQNAKNITKYSSKYSDTTWRHQKAVLAYINYIEYDVVGDVKYYYGGSVKITHREDFY